MKKIWTVEENNRFIDYIKNGMPEEQIAANFGISETSVVTKLASLIYKFVERDNKKLSDIAGRFGLPISKIVELYKFQKDYIEGKNSKKTNIYSVKKPITRSNKNTNLKELFDIAANLNFVSDILDLDHERRLAIRNYLVDEIDNIIINGLHENISNKHTNEVSNYGTSLLDMPLSDTKDIVSNYSSYSIKTKKYE